MYSLHSSAEMLRMRLVARPLQRLINRFAMPRKSHSVRFRRSFLASSASSTARAKVIVFSRRRSSSSPAAMHAMARLTRPLPASNARFATNAASSTSTPVCRSTSTAASSVFLSDFVFIVIRIRNPCASKKYDTPTKFTRPTLRRLLPKKRQPAKVYKCFACQK